MNIVEHNKEIGQRIKQMREQLGLSQEELAKRIGSSNRSTVSNYEQGNRTFKQSQIALFSKALNTTPAYLMGWEEEHKKGVKIPVLGHIQAGIPVEAIEDILDWEEIDEKLAKTGDYFCLQVRGKSMQPKFSEGDVVVVRQQSDVDSGQIAIVLVNGENATIKQVQKFNGGITLVPFNNAYPTQTYTNKEIKSLPVTILGRVVELRAKF